MTNIFANKGLLIDNNIHLSAKEAHECAQQGAIFVDVRETFMSSIKTFDVPEIIISPLKDFSQNIQHLPKNKYLIFVDATGVKSKPAMEMASREGFKKVANLSGGLVDWERDGLPTLTYQNILVSGRNKCEFINVDGKK